MRPISFPESDFASDDLKIQSLKSEGERWRGKRQREIANRRHVKVMRL